MSITSLDESLVAKIRSSLTIDSFSQCVNELVLNSLDAKATSIAIRVNLSTFRIQVIDNGNGISYSNLKSVGIRYMTNKCHTLTDLKKHLKFYGFKGEALASIARVSHRVIIVSREENVTETYEKTIENDSFKIEITNTRPSVGTTVTVEGFLGKLPVRQQYTKNNEIDNIRKNLEALIIIHPRISFTLRNDVSSSLILTRAKCPDVACSFKSIHPQINDKDFTLIRVCKNKNSVEGLIHKDFYENKSLQYFYVNKRPIICPKLQNFVNTSFKKCVGFEGKKKFPIFVIHIKCLYSDVDITLEPNKTLVYFKRFEIIKKNIEKVLNNFFGKENVQPVDVKTRSKRLSSEFGVSQIGGAVKGVGKKRKCEHVEETKSNKSMQIIDNTPYYEEVKIPTKQAKIALPIVIKKHDREKEEGAKTNFTENEKKGKDVIMDMFITSLNAFPPDNYEKIERVSVGVQTSPSLTDKDMVSVGVQAEFNLDTTFDPNFTFFPRKPLQKFVSDYNFDFSKFEKFPSYYNKDTNFFANFNQTTKIFDFQRKNIEDCNLFPNLNQHSIYSCIPDNVLIRNSNSFENLNKNRDVDINNFEETKDADFDQKSYYTMSKFLQDKSETESFKSLSEIGNLTSKKNIPKQATAIIQSPYFSRKLSNVELKNETQKFKGTFQMDTSSDLWKTPKVSTDFQNIETFFMKKEITRNNFNESNVSKYFSFEKPKISSVKPKILDTSNNLFKDLFKYSKSLELLEDKSKNEIIETEKDFAENIITQTLIQSENQPKFATTEKMNLTFDFAERYNFVPKGLSPILKDYGKVEDMSPKSKKQLQNAIVESYDDELLVIKWQNYLQNQDAKKFFEEIYLEKSKLIESGIPKANKSAYTKTAARGFETMSFTKKFLKNIQVIGQVDRKFIAAFHKKQKLILLFDQHAVHERVRLEELSQSYKNSSIKLVQNITIFLPQNDLHLLKGQKPNLNLLGLKLDFFANGIIIFEVPLCIYNKSKKGVDIVALTEILIKEIVDILKMNNGIIVSTPKVIQNIVNSEACRGAIKFGDVLTKTECIVHLKQLALCDLPFQCAHGRPTLTPLIFLNTSHDFSTRKPQLGKLRKYI